MISKAPVNFVTSIFNVVLIVSTVYSLDLNNTATTTTTSTPTATTTEYSVTETILIASSLNSSSVDHVDGDNDDFDEISNNFKGDQFNNTDGNSTATTTIINNATLTPTPAPTQAITIEDLMSFNHFSGIWKNWSKCLYDACFGCSVKACPFCTPTIERCTINLRETIHPYLLTTIKKNNTDIAIDSSSTSSNSSTSTTSSPSSGNITMLTAEPVKGTEEYLDYLWTKLLKCGYDTCFNCFKQECNWCTSKAENCMKLAGETIWPILISTLKEDELPDIIDPPAPIKSKVSTVKVNETTSSTTPMSTATPASTSTLTPTSNHVNGSPKPDIATIITTTIEP